MKGKISLSRFGISVLCSLMMMIPFSANGRADSSVKVNDRNFPDPKLRDAVLEVSGDSILDEQEIQAFTTLTVEGVNDIRGIELLTNLKKIVLKGGSVQELKLDSSTLYTIYVEDYPNLTNLDISSSNNCSSFDVKNCPKLYSVKMPPSCENIRFYDCTSLTSLDVSELKELNSVVIRDSGLRSLVLNSKNTKVSIVDIQDCPYLSKLDLHVCPKINRLVIENAPVSSLDISGCSNMGDLRVIGTNVKDIDLSEILKLNNTVVKGTETLGYGIRKYDYFGRSLIELSENITVKTKPVTIYDPNDFVVDKVLRDQLINNYDLNGDGLFDEYEFNSVRDFSISDYSEITTFEGLNNFPNLFKYQSQRFNYKEVDLSKIPCKEVGIFYSTIEKFVIPDNCGIECLYSGSTDFGTDILYLGHQDKLREFTCGDYGSASYPNVTKQFDISDCPILVKTITEGKFSERNTNSGPAYEYTLDDSSHGRIYVSANVKIKYTKAIRTKVSGNGSVTGAGDYIAGTKVTLKAAPDKGMFFHGWFVNGKLVTLDTEYTFTADKDVKVEAKFSSNTPTEVPKTVTPTPKATATPKVTVAAQPTSVSSKPSVVPDGIPSEDPQAKKIMDFVKRIYIYVLDREPEEEGAAFWSSELWSFRRTGAEVAQGFIFSEEFENRNTFDKEFVTILYKTFFGRDPEEEGMNFWLSQLSSGTMDRVTVANGFIYSQEWADTCASYGIRSGGELKPTGTIEPTDLTYAFVERMYTTALGRGYDAEGRQYWASALANFEVTGEGVGAFFFLSDEMNGYGLSDEEFLGRLYATFMNREPDSDGSAYWLGVMASGMPRADVVFGFTRSPEFTDKCIEARILPY